MKQTLYMVTLFPRKIIFYPEKETIVSHIYTYLSDTQPRNDYGELLELSIIFLGEKDSEEIKFKQLGAMHYVR